MSNPKSSKKAQETVGPYLAETGYAFGKGRLKPPGEPPRKVLQKSPPPRVLIGYERAPRLLIGYEHARCNTNTDLIMPLEGVGELASIEAVNAFEPAVEQLAVRHAPTCPVCGTQMNFAVWGPHDDEVETRKPFGSHED